MRFTLLKLLISFAVLLTFPLTSFSYGLLWMTDGSPVVFKDTQKLESVLTPASILGQQPYEGAVDYLPAVGDTELLALQNHYVSLEAEWVLIKSDGFTSPVDSSTEVILQGMADTKFFSAFYENQGLWQPASIGNNVIAEGFGIKTTLGELANGEVNANLSIRYKDARGRQHEYKSNAQSISDLPLIEIINAVIDNNSDVITHINLGAIEDESAWVNLGSVRAIATLKALMSCAFMFTCQSQPLPEQVLFSIANFLIIKDAYMAESAEIIMTDSQGNQQGGATITIQP